jgi:hypothetical protein
MHLARRAEHHGPKAFLQFGSVAQTERACYFSARAHSIDVDDSLDCFVLVVRLWLRQFDESEHERQLRHLEQRRGSERRRFVGRKRVSG